MSLSYLNFRFIGEVYRVPYSRMILEQSPSILTRIGIADTTPELACESGFVGVLDL
jgi:hypothetical protein